jgi:DNA-binding IclR family transcriptional regulator
MGDEAGVAAVDRALSILDAFAESDAKLSLAEISKRTGLYKSTVLRLAKSLEKFGYIYRADDGGYRLGSKTLLLGSLYQRHFRMAHIVPPVLQQIVDELKEGASLYVRDGEHRVCLHRVESTHAVRDAVHEGDRLPLTVGASSHIIRAFDGATGTRYDQIRRDMYSASYGERDPETAAIACPVFGVGKRFVGALAVSGPRYRLEALGLGPILPVLFKHAIELTRVLGGDAEGLARAMPKRKSTKAQLRRA